MKCPYCNKEMIKGVVSGDGRSTVIFSEGIKPTKLLDRLDGSGALIPQKRTLSRFLIDACFCKDCKKLIIDTDVK
ncbi:MAG: PF20097 family protein [Oscillospiraceae bacterium]|nr:PF20097 family protein [Oscillospiraceae bacterium]